MRPQDAAVILGLMFRFVRELGLTWSARSGSSGAPARSPAGALISDRARERLRRGQHRLAERLGRLFDDHDVPDCSTIMTCF